MKEITCCVIVDDEELKFSINHKINVIYGDSGCGKTYITSRLADYGTTVFVVRSIADVDIVLDSNPSSNRVFWFDEDMTLYVKKSHLLPKINAKNHICIFISRDNLNGITYSYKAVYELVSNKSNYKLQRVYPDYNLMPSGDSYITEDSCAGFYYYTKFLHNVMHPNKGEDMIGKAVSENAVLIADGIAFGSSISKALSLGIRLNLQESFEYMVGYSLFGDSIFNYTIQDMVDNNNKTEEKCITRLLIEYCKKLNPPIHYDKTDASIKGTIIECTKFFSMLPSAIQDAIEQMKG